MKTHEEWILSAQSTDQTRYDLCGIWRYQTYLLACDGYRMHYRNGLEPVGKPYMLSGADAQPLTFEAVIPTNTPRYEAKIVTSKDLIKKLTAMIKMIKLASCYGKAPAKFEVCNKYLTISYSFKDLNISTKIALTEEPALCGSVSLTLQYFVDAIDICSAKYENPEVTIGFRSGELAPITIEHPLGNAIIMPCKA